MPKIWKQATPKAYGTRTVMESLPAATIPPCVTGRSSLDMTLNAAREAERAWSIPSCPATNRAWLIRYGARMGLGPKRRCDMVTVPDFLES